MRLFPKKPKPGFEIDPDLPPNTGASYRSVLSALHRSLQPEWYIEIGSRTGASLALSTGNYIAIDPEFVFEAPALTKAREMAFFQMTSDAFFEQGYLKQRKIQPQLAFIDGMHLMEFALRDFINCEKTMSKDGVICLHDPLPFNVPMATRDTDYLEVLRRPWTGDVWKAVAAIRTFRPELKIQVLNAKKTGITVVSNLDPKSEVLTKNYEKILDTYMDMDFKEHSKSEYYDKIEISDASAFVANLA
jgi:hypothetical protein